MKLETKYIRYILYFLLFVSICVNITLVYLYINKRVEILNKDSLIINKTIPVITSFGAPKGTIQVSVFSGTIHIYPVTNESEDNSPYKSLTIEEKDYPNLFKNDNLNSYFLETKKQEQDGVFQIVISNNVFSRGGYYPTYSLLINLLTGEITETKNFH